MKNYHLPLLCAILFLQISSISSQPFISKAKDISLLFGDINRFSFGEAAFMDVGAISGNKAIVVYRDWGNLGFGTAKIGAFSDDKITFGDSVVFSASNTFLPKTKTVNDSVFLVVYRDMDQSGKGVIVKGILANNSIVFGQSLPFSSAMISSTSLIMMDSISFLIAYKDNGNNGFGTTRSGNLEEGEIILGQEYVFNEATSYENVLMRLSDTTFLISYRDAGNGEAGTLKIGEIINGNIVFNEAAVFSPSPAWDISVAKSNPDRFIISYSNNNETGESILGEIENGLVSFSDPMVFSETEISGTSTIAINDSVSVVSYSDEFNNGTGVSVLAKTVSGETTFGEPVVFNNEGSYTLNGVLLSDSSFLLVFRDEGNEFSGSAIIGKIGFDTSTGIAQNKNRLPHIYPNPSNGLVYLEGEGILKIELTDLNGQIISVFSTNENLIDLRGMDKGIYFLKIYGNGIFSTGKLIIQ